MADLETLLLADTSAWHRGSVPAFADLWEDNLQDDRIAITAPIRLEILYSAVSAEEYDAVARELGALRQLPCGDDAWARSLDVHRQLAHSGGFHHRSVKMPDLLVAAVAELTGATVWHYDEDFDRIAQITGQPVEWIAPRGSL